MVTRNHWINSDRRNFRIKKNRIRDALSGSTGIINGVTEQNKEDIFYMLLFCLCVPQSKAIKAEEAITILRDHDYFRKQLTHKQIIDILTGRVRFHSTKTDRLIQAKKMFFVPFPTIDLWDDLKHLYKSYQQTSGEARDSVLKIARAYLIKNINGMGMKLASHFLRNIGMSGLAILDVHIIQGMQKRELITEADIKPLTRIKYEHVSQVMKEYAQQVGISVDELDMLLWSQRTGYVFK